MRNKKGFTLTELLVVIALIGIILLLVVPNIIKLYNQGKKSLFYDEVLTLYNNSYTTYMYNSNEGDYTKRFCRGQDETTKLIDVEEREGLFYDITVNSYGEVLSMKVANKDYGIELYNNGSVIKKKSINKNDITDSYDLYCNGKPTGPTTPSLTCIITNDKRYCNIFEFSHSRENGTM